MDLGTLQHVGSSQPRDRTHVSGISRQFLHRWTTKETLKYTYFFDDLRKSSLISVSCNVKEGCDWAKWTNERAWTLPLLWSGLGCIYMWPVTPSSCNPVGRVRHCCTGSNCSHGQRTSPRWGGLDALGGSLTLWRAKFPTGQCLSLLTSVPWSPRRTLWRERTTYF